MIQRNSVISMPHQKPAIIFDLDRTAVNSPKKRHTTMRLRRVIDRLRDDFYICAATGRPWAFARPILQELRLTDPCVVAAGSRICDPRDGSTIWKQTISKRTLDRVILVLQRFPQYRLVFNDFSEMDYRDDGTPLAEMNWGEKYYYLNILSMTRQVANRLKRRLDQIPGIDTTLSVSFHPGRIDVHITDRGATKDHAVSHLLRLLHVPKNQSIGIGDGYNDQLLFRAVGHKVAMGNAVPELKKQAHQIIGDVAQDGLARFLEGLIIDDENS